MSVNHELSDLFANLAAICEIKGENTFKAIAFSKVSRLLRDLSIDLREYLEQGRLDQIQGIGASSQRIIEQYLKSGRSEDYEQALASIPPGLLELLHIPNLGPKTIALFWKERGITNLDELVKAMDSGALANLKGVGEKKLATIRAGIELRKKAGERLGIGHVLPVAEALLVQLRTIKAVKEASIAGSLRRRRETVGDVDLVCCVKDPAAAEGVAQAFTHLGGVAQVLGQGATKASVRTADGLQVDLRIVPAESYGAALLYFTGSKDHSVRLRSRAQDQGRTLNEWGLYDLAAYEKTPRKTGEAPALKPLASKTEADVYRALGLAYIEPELREDRGEIEAAEADRLPRLVTQDDIRGDLHCHTVASDGTATIEQMAEAAKALGYEYLAITDHSQSQAIARGLNPERLRQHIAAVRQAAKRVRGIALLAGSEVDILADGRLDYEDALLAELDIVVASPHVALRQTPEKATERLLRAIENPHVHVIGHPTGRVINLRGGLEPDFPKLFRAAAASRTALEINSGYPRLDLDERHARAAMEAGVMLSINTDAHTTMDFAFLSFGLGVARRAWLEPRHVLNCMPLTKLRAWLKK